MSTKINLTSQPSIDKSTVKLIVRNIYSQITGADISLRAENVRSNQPAAIAEIDSITLSGLTVSSQGVVSEHWDRIENIPAVVVSSDDGTVTLDCLVNYEQQIFEKRSFNASAIGQNLQQSGQILLIKIFSKVNEIRFTFSDGTGLFNAEYFMARETEEIYQRLAGRAKDLTKKLH